VLEYRKELATATLLPGSETPVSKLEDAFFFYVKSGEGRLDDGKQYWDLHEGIAVLAPPNVAHRFVNLSRDKELSMIMLQFTGAPGAHSELVVRDVPKLPWCEENAHWNNASRCVFSTADGLLQGERIYLVMLQPWSVSQPHSHGAGTEEIWTKVTPGNAVMLLGSELRDMPEDSAYLVPPTGTTDHSNLNLSKDKTEWWIYIARGPAPVPGAPARGGGGRGGGRGPANSNLSRDTTTATIAGKPLK
jgi:mannose-6-phosphate isomerase-like protein (cupin superfamily)